MSSRPLTFPGTPNERMRDGHVTTTCPYEDWRSRGRKPTRHSLTLVATANRRQPIHHLLALVATANRRRPIRHPLTVVAAANGVRRDRVVATSVSEWLREWLRPCCMLLFLALIVMPARVAAATIEGSVALPKTRAVPVQNQRYEIVSKAGVLSTNPPLAVVYLDGDFPAGAAPAVQQVAQRDLMFEPSLLPVRVGTRVEFPNLDSTYHNIFSFSPAKRFDLGRYRSDERPIPSVVFDVPGLVTLRCDIHEHMRGLILVLKSPYFVVTQPDGRFRLEGLPAGHYVLKAWVSSRTTREQPVDLTAGTTLHVDFP